MPPGNERQRRASQERQGEGSPADHPPGKLDKANQWQLFPHRRRNRQRHQSQAKGCNNQEGDVPAPGLVPEKKQSTQANYAQTELRQADGHLKLGIEQRGIRGCWCRQ